MRNKLNSENIKVATSVVIITHNRPDYLAQSLKGVAEQSTKADEVIVVDDFSSVDYSVVLNQFSELNIKYHKLPEPSGANKARNEGIKLASNALVLLLDDDDIWMPNYITEHIACYENGADAVVSGHQRLGSDIIKINDSAIVTEEELRKGNRFCGMSGVSVKRDILINHPLDEALGNGQDWDLFVRVCRAQYKFVNIRKAIFYYRMGTPDGITSKVRKMTVHDIDNRLKAAEKHREWLGEKYYKERVAEQVLSFLPSKKNKLSWIKKSISLIGVFPTINHLVTKLFGEKRSD
mgnify:CR=1 FL=1|tara:strand:- start:1792 stop:2670 length:879 start_codon:yes stop_codon:yes gene_type:complete